MKAAIPGHKLPFSSAVAVLIFVILTNARPERNRAAETTSPADATVAEPKDVPFAAVSITGDFWAQRQRTNVLSSLPAVIEREEKSGEVENFALAADAVRGNRHGLH